MFGDVCAARKRTSVPVLKRQHVAEQRELMFVCREQPSPRGHIGYAWHTLGRAEEIWR